MDKNELVLGNTMTKNTEEKASYELTPTLELKKHGYLALTKGICGSPPGFNNPQQLSREASELFELLSRDQIMATPTQGSEEIRGFRQSSIDTEPQTLSLISVRQAKVISYIPPLTISEVVHLFSCFSGKFFALSSSGPWTLGTLIVMFRFLRWKEFHFYFVLYRNFSSLVGM